MDPVGEDAEDEEQAEGGIQLAVGQQSHHHISKKQTFNNSTVYGNVYAHYSEV